ncbi:MAG TPA: glycosyltransferase, partial [Verrucomicrobiota bacterium]|nr:glycosyltransferase [Verrucomicrobiota bacterium]
MGLGHNIRILYLTAFWPHRSGIGPELRSRNILAALRDIGQVDVAVLHDDDLPADTIKQFAHESSASRTAPVSPRPEKGVAKKLRWLFKANSPFPHGCGVDERFESQLMHELGGYDLVWHFKLRTPNLFVRQTWPRSVVDIDDVPSTFERAAADYSFGLRRMLSLARMWNWRRRERLLDNRFSALAVCSEGDRQYLRNIGVHAPLHVIPNGSEKPACEPLRNPAMPPRIGFIGLFDYLPNSEGIQWFAKQCWPRIKQHIPAARLRLMGKGTDGPLKPSGRDIDALGWVEDAAAEMATWSLMIVPIHRGAGTRLKIAQGFSAKCPIVSTSLGAYGYELRNGRELFLADAALPFAEACVRVVRQPADAARMADRAWRQFLDKWTWDAIRPRVHAAAEDVL